MNARTWRILALSVSGLAMMLVLIIGFFPWGLLKPLIERRLEERFARPVVIGQLERVDRFGFTPVIAISDVRIPHPSWVGDGDFVRLARARASLPLAALLTGGFAPRDVQVTGLALSLVRDKDGRTNWKRPGEPKGKASAPELGAITVRDSVVHYRDAKRQRAFVLHLSSEARTGVQGHGNGVVLGQPVRLALAAPPISSGADRPWPFTVIINGPALIMRAKGVMDRPLDTEHMALNLTARATDLKMIDAIIEAGLFRTQPVALKAHVRRDPARWAISGLTGSIGRSDLAGSLTVNKVSGRTRLEGDLVSRQFDFDDLASDEGLARGRALRRAIGPRIVPNTRVDLSKLGKTDGVLRVRLGRVMSAGVPTGLRSGSGRLTLDHQLLKLEDARVRLRSGVLTGRIVVDQTGGRQSPLVTVDLRLKDSEFSRLTGGGISGAAAVHIHLTGTGKTIREAIGTSNGRIGLVVRDGALPKRIAYAAGFAPGKALAAGRSARAGLRCGVVRLAMRHGRGVAAPLLIDTTESQLRGDGTVTFPDERLALRLRGAAKHAAILRLDGSASIRGTISEPSLDIPPATKSVGNFFKAIGRAIRGRQEPLAGNADCHALAATALR